MKKNNFKGKTFDRPNLPFGWLATVFIAPVLVATLPSIFAEDNISIEFRVIVGLILMVILLIVSCFSLVLRLYDESYNRQVLDLRLDHTEKKVDELERIEKSQSLHLDELAEKVLKINSMSGTIKVSDNLNQSNTKYSASSASK